MINVVNVSKKYKNLVLFENLNLTIPTGKKVLIKGINGSGKSVFLKLLVGYARCDSGHIEIDGFIIGKDADFINDAGVMINSPEFIGSLSGWDNLTILADIRKIATKEDIEGLVRYFELNDSIHKKYKTYSLGMKQKMRIIQAVMEKPKYLILDEPFDALDLHSQDQLLQLLSDYMEDKSNTLIYTSHNPKYEKYADMIGKIDNYGIQLT